jgi:hypothetical protein
MKEPQAAAGLPISFSYSHPDANCIHPHLPPHAKVFEPEPRQILACAWILAETSRMSRKKMKKSDARHFIFDIHEHC